ncbi:hypothetical protein Nepgr_030633 [Nepenthes gracilis]|uniref:Plastidal glycolate/glycerate translocator 1, chloroplastic n=1 Tax=Nepenthes gracilis TaxID=150966 RepID=A0AAD3TEY6_NEPGR|nr:hypothetical protein Nepgr_030633 [Nepenthes gracilis]
MIDPSRGFLSIQISCYHSNENSFHIHFRHTSMAVASAIPTNLPFYPSSSHHHTKFTPSRCLNSLTKSFKLPSRRLPLPSNGVKPTKYQSDLADSAILIRVLGHSSRLLHSGTHRTRPKRIILAKSSSSNSSITSTTSHGVFDIMHLIVSLGIILAMDKLLKEAFAAAAIKFPSALFGMFCVFTILMILDSTVAVAATNLLNFFEPAVLFIQRWLPLFYVPSLVVLPLAVRDIPAASGVKICLIIVGGWMASLCVAGFTAIAVRKLVKTEMIPAEPMAKAAPFSAVEVWMWSGIFLISFVAAYLYPAALGTNARTCLPFLLAATVLGYMLGSGLPSGVKKVFHPIICCALSADLAALAFGYISHSGIDPVLGYYLTKMPSNPGAGDILMGFLGSVIISFAFSMFKQRKLMKRHAAEIFTSIIIATLFSLYSTALMGRLLGLERALIVSILPRCITVALALSIVSFFEGANSSLTAATVVLTGLVGANFVQAVLDRLQFRDPIARGIATASSAHGLGTAALSAKEPEALPFCAIAYALTGIFGSLICSVPAVRQGLLAVAITSRWSKVRQRYVRGSVLSTTVEQARRRRLQCGTSDPENPIFTREREREDGESVLFIWLLGLTLGHKVETALSNY